MTIEKFLPYGRQSIDESDVNAVQEALLSGVLTRGKKVEEFEEAIASFTTAKYAVAFSNGSTALSVAYQALQGTSSDTLFTSPNTFIATAAGAKKLGMSVQYADIDSFGNANFEAIADKINQPRSRGRTFIAPVHFAGVAIDMKNISDLIKAPHTVIIEDAAHALGSLYPDGSCVGSCLYSDMTVFSFHPVKNITSGEGGIITTNSEELYKRLKMLRNSGIDRETLLYKAKPAAFYYEVHELSSNYHMTELQAALGLSQLRRISTFREKKKKIVQWYRKKLATLPGIELPPQEADLRSLYHLFVIRIRFQELGIEREEFMDKLSSMGIGSQLHYVPMYNHSALGPRSRHYQTEFPKMEEYFQTALSIPFFVDMEEEDVDRVVVALRSIILMRKDK